MPPITSSSDIQENIPSLSMVGLMYNPMFGNIGFGVQPSQSGEVSNSFGTVPYMSLEGLINMMALNSQTSPTSILPGQNTGQQNVQGNYTITDETGNVRMVMGYQRGGFS